MHVGYETEVVGEGLKSTFFSSSPSFSAMGTEYGGLSLSLYLAVWDRDRKIGASLLLLPLLHEMDVEDVGSVFFRRGTTRETAKEKERSIVPCVLMRMRVGARGRVKGCECGASVQCVWVETGVGRRLGHRTMR
jgi:hypothetical protein